jgi:hypothetical protein
LQKVQLDKDNSQATCLVENHVVVTVAANLVAANLGTVVVAANLGVVVELIADIKH